VFGPHVQHQEAVSQQVGCPVYSRALRASRAYEQDCGTVGVETAPAHPAKSPAPCPVLRRPRGCEKRRQHQEEHAVQRLRQTLLGK
jgi:hypothetical protein